MIETTERETARETILGIMDEIDERSLASLMDYAAYLRELERRENEEDIRLAKEALAEEGGTPLEEIETRYGVGADDAREAVA